MPSKRKLEYQHSRGYARFALSNLFKIDPLMIPLFAPPGKPPKLGDGWGHMNISHCSNALLIGWSPQKIGVDLENIDRKIEARKIAKKIFFKEEEELLIRTKNDDELRDVVLSTWVKKEAAIKWQKGSIYKDINEWYFCDETGLAKHKSLDYEICIDAINFKSWKIAIAYEKNLHFSEPIICFDTNSF